MKILELIRLETHQKYGTRGVLRINKELFCMTLELPWKMNQRDVSCIPAGTYEVEQVDSPTFGLSYEVMNVPGRSNILFHVGNTIRDSTGCILLGRKYQWFNGTRAVMQSSRTMEDFVERMTGSPKSLLTVIEVY